MSLLIVGCGYVGLEVARQWNEIPAGQVDTVYALTRSTARLEELQSRGILPLVGDWLAPESLPDLPPIQHVLVAVPHRSVENANGNDLGFAAEQTHALGLANLYRWLHDQLPQIPPLIYLSTTGVYGDSSVLDVDESTPVSPTRIGPAIAVEAERWLSQGGNEEAPQGFASVIRLAGIYGPGRIPLADRLRAGEPLAVPREGYLNLVHVEDIARVLCHGFKNGLRERLYLLSDGSPVLRETFYQYLAELCGVPDPQFTSPAANDPKARRATNKRVNPSRILNETGVRLRFPSYREGLRDTVQSS